MITLDHIKQLDRKVHKAIDEINTLRAENKMLMEDLDKYQHRIEELEIMINAFKEDQSEIESGIIDALNQLDILEENVATSDSEQELVPDSSEKEKEQEAMAPEIISHEENSSEPVIVQDEETQEQEDKSGEGESELDIF